MSSVTRFLALTRRLADEEVGEVDKLAWERVQAVWAKRRKTIDERRRAAAKLIDT